MKTKTKGKGKEFFRWLIGMALIALVVYLIWSGTINIGMAKGLGKKAEGVGKEIAGFFDRTFLGDDAANSNGEEGEEGSNNGEEAGDGEEDPGDGDGEPHTSAHHNGVTIGGVTYTI